jgi:ribonuclease R
MSKKTGKRKPTAPLKGTLEITRSGMGYVIVNGREKDLLVKPQDFNKAMDGDIVQVRVKDTNGKRLEGKIEGVLQRKQTEFIGDIHISENFAFFAPDSQKPLPDFYISLKNLNGAKDKDRVVVKFLNWENSAKKPEGKVVTVLDAIKDVRFI